MGAADSSGLEAMTTIAHLNNPDATRLASQYNMDLGQSVLQYSRYVDALESANGKLAVEIDDKAPIPVQIKSLDDQTKMLAGYVIILYGLSVAKPIKVSRTLINDPIFLTNTKMFIGSEKRVGVLDSILSSEELLMKCQRFEEYLTQIADYRKALVKSLPDSLFDLN
ncbi:MAG: hypothetical protein ABIC95_03550 [archaeon]